MKTTDLFGIAVRAISLWFIAGAAASMAAVLVAPGAANGVGLNLLVGSVLFFQSDGFVRAAHGRARTDASD